MTKAKISEYDAVAANNTDVNGVNISEGCPPSSMNNMGREIMAALKRFQTGADGDSVTVGGSLVVSNTLTAGPVSATTLNTSGAVVFNDAGADVDFRVESDTNENAFFLDGATGNIGVSVTPSAWASTWKVLQSLGGFVGSNSTGGYRIASNSFSNGTNWVYVADGFASGYQQLDGTHSWSTAASGTAGNNITFTESMRIDSSGYITSTASNPQISFVDSANSSYKWSIQNTSSAIRFYDNTANAERMRIDSNGKTGIGFSAPNARLVVAGNGSDGSVAGTRNVLQLRNSNSSGNQSNWISFGSAGSETYCYITNDINADGTTVNQLNIQAGATGGVYLANGGTSWTAVSDERIKDIIEPIENAADKVATLRTVIGKYKTDAEDVRRVFLIAQDVQAVLPEAVTISSDEMNTLGLSYAETIPLLVAAIKELKAELDTVKAELATLKGQ